MKIRNGFVSNSSSSSFVVLASEEAHMKAVSKLTEYEKAVIDELIKKETVFGKSTYCIGNMNDNGGYSSAYEENWQPEGWEDKIEKMKDEDEDTDDFYPSEALYKYCELVEEQPKTEWFKWEADM